MQQKELDSWFNRRARLAAQKDRLNLGDIVGESIAILAIVLITAYFVYSQISSTGFFTSAFGPTEMMLFYGAGLFGIVTSLGRILVGRRNPIRPLEVAGSLLWATASFTLLVVFPFNFAHVADALPSAIQFAFSWISDNIGRFILILGGVVSLLQAAYTIPFYFRVKRILETQTKLQQAGEQEKMRI